MGIQVEYNPDLALRAYSEYVAGKREKEECLPEILEEGSTHPFLKKGQRLYWLHGEMPLIETKGNGNLLPPLASIVILEASHFLVGNEVWTKGEYEIKEIFSDSRVHFNGFAKIT